jgi:LacI family transcriptional regulator
MVTIYDIARIAKTSHTTVSRALRGNSQISPQTTARILQVARELEYAPSHSAKSLKSGKTNSIGVLVRSLKSHFYTDFFTALDDTCYKHGYSVFVTTSEFDAAREERNLKAFLSKQFDAVVFDRSQPELYDNIIHQIIDQGIKVILLGEVDVPNLPYPVVGFDEIAVARLAAEHLWSLGHRNILYFNAEKTKDASVRTHQVRRANFTEAWKKISHSMDVPCFQTADPYFGGKELADYLEKLPNEKRPTAVVCSTDPLAVSTLSVLHARNIKVPDYISIISCDDVEAPFIPVPLTTIRLPRDKEAQGVWQLLQNLITGTKTEINRVIVQPELIIRESTRAI